MKLYYFSGDLAIKYGIIEATFLQVFYRVVSENRFLCVVENGMYWFPCAIKEWGDYIDAIWTPRQIDRIVKNCIHDRAIFIGHYDTDERRNRGWYAINKELIPSLEEAERKKSD